MPKFKDVQLDRYHYTIEITGFGCKCPYCGHITTIETDQMGNNITEDFCHCFVSMDDKTGLAAYTKKDKK